MAANPVLAQMLQALAARNAMGGSPPGGAPAAVAGGPPPGPGGPGPGGPGPGGPGPMGAGANAGDIFNQMQADLSKADPSQTMNTMKQIKQVLGAMVVHNMEPNPAFSGQVAKIIPMFDRALKELEKAGSVSGAVRQPIQMGAAMPTPSPGGGPGAGPGAMGPMGPMGA